MPGETDFTVTDWLDGARVRDLSYGFGNGRFSSFLGVILHVNVDENGTPINFWGPGNGGSVTPNFQVFKDGSVDQLLPFNWQPWCQVDGNFNYAAIETAGLPGEPLTEAQCASIARILAVYHAEHGMQLRLANSPGEAGFGLHSMGGAAWGGHSCPGDVRAAQRQHILNLVAQPATPTATRAGDDDMRIVENKDRQCLALLIGAGEKPVLLTNSSWVRALVIAGVPVAKVPDVNYQALRSWK